MNISPIIIIEKYDCEEFTFDKHPTNSILLHGYIIMNQFTNLNMSLLAKWFNRECRIHYTYFINLNTNKLIHQIVKLILFTLYIIIHTYIDYL